MPPPKKLNRKFRDHSVKIHAIADGCAIVAILLEVAKDLIVLGAIAALVILLVTVLEG